MCVCVGGGENKKCVCVCGGEVRTRNVYSIAGIFRGYKFSQMDHYKGFRGFYFRGLSSSLLAHAHINMQLYLHTVSLESIILNTPTIHKFSRYRLNLRKPRTFTLKIYPLYGMCMCVGGENKKCMCVGGGG